MYLNMYAPATIREKIYKREYASNNLLLRCRLFPVSFRLCARPYEYDENAIKLNIHQIRPDVRQYDKALNNRQARDKSLVLVGSLHHARHSIAPQVDGQVVAAQPDRDEII